MWLESIGVVSGCFPHITYISLLLLYLLVFAATSLLLFSFCYKKKNAKWRFLTSRGAYVKLRYIAILYTHSIGNQP